MAEGTPVRIISKPGIKRDGTLFEGENYVDALWCRFNRGLPRKIGGYQAVTSSIPELVRGMTSFSQNDLQYLHLGSASRVSQIRVDSSGVFSGLSDRTPAAFPSSTDILWQFESMYDSVSGGTILVGHPGHNLSTISSSTTSDIYTGNVTAATALTAAGLADPESGGIVALAPYLIKFGNGGRFAWSVPNKPTDFAGAGSGVSFVTGQKIVRGLPLRGSSGPAGIFWSLDSVLRATFDSTTLWNVNTVSGESSILSSQGVIEYDSIYYWPGVDRFLAYNGVVQELPNDMNQNYFFDNLNYAHRQKVFAFKVPRWGEIWWCYPRGSATECTHAIIYNVREKTWYDTSLPGSGRCAGVFAKVYSKPFMVDVDLTTDGYTLWQHETGVDEINASVIRPIRSYFETNEISMLTGDSPKDQALRISRMEQDFVQTGDMTLTITGRANARAPETVSGPYVFPDTATSAAEQVINLKDNRRLMRFKFESNTTSGDYQMGQCFGHISPSDGRITQ